MAKSPNSFHLFHGKMKQSYGETLRKQGKIRNAALPDRPSHEQNFVLVAHPLIPTDVLGEVETSRKRETRSSLLISIPAKTKYIEFHNFSPLVMKDGKHSVMVKLIIGATSQTFRDENPTSVAKY